MNLKEKLKQLNHDHYRNVILELEKSLDTFYFYEIFTNKLMKKADKGILSFKSSLNDYTEKQQLYIISKLKLDNLKVTVELFEGEKFITVDWSV